MESMAYASLSAMMGQRVLGEEQRKPNLLFVMTDQQRWDAMSCAGNSVLKTPSLDRLAREGARFVNAYTAQPVCVPARAVLLTGLSPVNVHVEGNGDYDRKDVPDVPTFDSILMDHGYVGEYYGKWHTPYKFTACYSNEVREVGKHGAQSNHSEPKAYWAYLERKGVPRRDPGAPELFSRRHQRPYHPIPLDSNYGDLGLDSEKKLKLKSSQSGRYGCVDLPPRVSYTAFTATETLQALDRLKDKTFTLTCSFGPPHPPMVVQEPYFSMYPPETIPVPESITDSMKGSPYRARAASEKQQPFRNAEEIPKMRSIYYGMVREVDDWIGRILNKLDELGIADNTLVVFASDHGEMLGDHGMHSKMVFYEGGAHVPLLIRFPGRIKPGTVIETPVSLMDVCPTILDYLNKPIPRCDGISLRPLIEGEPVEHYAISYWPASQTPNYMIRHGDLKLMIAEKESNRSVDALYDLKTDPLEMRNLLAADVVSDRHLAQGRRLKVRLVKWLQEHEPHKAQGLQQRTLTAVQS